MITFRLAIDPGDVHVGWACWKRGQSVRAGEWTVNECLDEVRRMLTPERENGMEEEAAELIIEEYVLYPNVNQSFSPMKTSQLIGALKLIAHDCGVPVIEQGAVIKKPTRRQLPARGLQQVGETIHARDAELHLYYRLLREGDVK